MVYVKGKEVYTDINFLKSQKFISFTQQVDATHEFVFYDADVEKEAAKLIDFLKQTAFSGMVNKILEQVEANLEKAQAEMEKPLS